MSAIAWLRQLCRYSQSLKHNVSCEQRQKKGELDLVWGFFLVLAVFSVSAYLSLVLLMLVGWNPFVGHFSAFEGCVAALMGGSVAVWGLFRWAKGPPSGR